MVVWIGNSVGCGGSSGHRLFISAFMLVSKIICDDTYFNKSWCIVGQGMSSLQGINQMEREMRSYLKRILDPELAEFEAEVKRDYGTGVIRASDVIAPMVRPY